MRSSIILSRPLVSQGFVRLTSSILFVCSVTDGNLCNAMFATPRKVLLVGFLFLFNKSVLLLIKQSQIVKICILGRHWDTSMTSAQEKIRIMTHR